MRSPLDAWDQGAPARLRDALTEQERREVASALDLGYGPDRAGARSGGAG
ncbi:hypothetical protein [Streptomyces sp. PvR034]